MSGRTGNDLEHIRSLFERVCQSQVDPDAIEFDSAMVEVSRIAEDADYEGVRAKFTGLLARARIPMQIDVGFGDVIVPGPTEIEYPTLLDFPAPRLMAYPRETVVAEKLEALTQLGLLNSRMKDFSTWRSWPGCTRLTARCWRRRFQLPLDGVRHASRPTRSACRRASASIRRRLCSGEHSCDGADSKNPLTSLLLFVRCEGSPILCSLRSPAANHSAARGLRAGLGRIDARLPVRDPAIRPFPALARRLHLSMQDLQRNPQVGSLYYWRCLLDIQEYRERTLNPV